MKVAFYESLYGMNKYLQSSYSLVLLKINI